MAKKRSKNPKFLNLFGIKLDYKDYVERFLPEQVEALTKLYRKQGFEWDLKYTTKSKGKYWDTKQSYPTNQNDFIKKFFKNKKPKGIEGIWQQQYYDQTITYGIVKEGKVYNAFFIKRGHFKQSTGSIHLHWQNSGFLKQFISIWSSLPRNRQANQICFCPIYFPFQTSSTNT